MSASAAAASAAVTPAGRRAETTAWIGMVLFLAAWAMMFAALFASYAFMRARAPVWPPAGLPRVPLALPALNTAVLMLSGALAQWGSAAPRRAGTALAALGGGLFLALQGVLWGRMGALGVEPSSAGAYGSVLYGFTWVHAAHVAVGVIGLGAVSWKGTARAAQLWTWYWHFVGVVWLGMFGALFVA